MKKFFLLFFLLYFPLTTYAGTNNPDLLNNLEINIKDDLSGVSQIKIELGGCTAIYDIENYLPSILNSTSQPNGVKDGYKDITLKYNESVVVEGKTYNSLLKQFGKDRLDRCLLEGKNYIIVTATDQARSNLDGISLAGNSKVLNTKTNNGFIKVDNTAPKLGLTGDMKNVFESQDSSECYIGGVNIDGKWKNYTIDGNMVYSDPFGNNMGNIGGCKTCDVFKLESKKCSGSLPSDPNAIWASPPGVDPVSGDYNTYVCDGVSIGSEICDWGCKPGYIKDPLNNKCISSSGSGGLFILFDEGNPLKDTDGAKLMSNTSISNGKMVSKPCTSGGMTNFIFDSLANYDIGGVFYKIKENGCTKNLQLSCGITKFKVGVDVLDSTLALYHDGYNNPSDPYPEGAKRAASNRYCNRTGCNPDIQNCTGTYSGLGFFGGGTYLTSTSGDEVMCVGGSNNNPSGAQPNVTETDIYNYGLTDQKCSEKCTSLGYKNGVSVERNPNITTDNIGCSCWDDC